MGLFGKSKKEKEAELQKEIDAANEKYVEIASSAIVSLEMSDEEREDIISKIESSLYEYNGFADLFQHRIINNMHKILSSKYPIFEDTIDKIKNELIEGVDETGAIDIETVNDLLFEINWEYNVTPDQAENILKNSYQGEPLDAETYKKVVQKISLRYEDDQMNELDNIKPDDIDGWIQNNKSDKRYMSDKVYAKAMVIKRGEKWDLTKYLSGGN